MSDRFEEFHFPLFYGAQNRRSEPSRFWFSFLGPSSLRIEARFWWATFRSLQIGIVLYVRLVCQIIWNKKRVACSWKRYRLIEKGALTLGHLTKLMMKHDQYNLLIGGSCLLYQQGACGPGATSCVWTWALSRNSFFCEAPQENSHKARARMLRAEGITVPGSKEASFFHRFYRIPCVGFSPFGWERELVYYCWKIAEQQFFYSCASFRMHGLYRYKSNNAFSSDRYHS